MRLQPNTPEAIFYLYKDEHEAYEGISEGGAGSYIAMFDDDDNFSRVFAVTNTHLIAQGYSTLRFNKAEGGIAVAPTDPNDWVMHPNGDDISILQIFSSDTFRTNEPDFTMHPAIKKYKNILTLEDVDKYNIGIGDEVNMISRHLEIEGVEYNLPIVRFGQISRMATRDGILNPHTGLHQCTIICEMRSTSGHSGSPVNVLIDRSLWRWKVLPEGEDKGVMQFLLGIDWGHITNTNNVKNRQDSALDTGLEVQTSSNLACVIPAWKIKEVIDSISET